MLTGLAVVDTVVPNLRNVSVLDPDWEQDLSIIKYLCQNLEAVRAPLYIGITLACVRLGAPIQVYWYHTS